MTLANVIELHTVAAGGRAAIESVQGIKIEYRLSEKTFEAEGVYIADRQRGMRVDIYMGGSRVFTEGYDSIQGWEWSRDAEHGLLVPPEASTALHSTIIHQLYGLHELPALGYTLEENAEVNLDGERFYVLQQMDPGGHVIWRFINTDTWLIERNREKLSLHPQINPEEAVIETIFSDFRELEGGIKRPFREIRVNLNTNGVLQRTEIQRVQINPVLDPEVFHCP